MESEEHTTEQNWVKQEIKEKILKFPELTEIKKKKTTRQL